VTKNYAGWPRCAWSAYYSLNGLVRKGATLFSVARVIEHLRRGARKQRALEFAEKYFRGCTAHVHEAVAVHGALEFLSRRELAECNSNWNVRDILGEPSESLLRWLREAPETRDNSQAS
jgi:hypothetical protein